MRVFGDKILKKIFCRKRDEQTGEWSELHYVIRHNLYGNTEERLSHVDYGGLEWEREEGHTSFWGKCPHGRLKIRWEDNII